MHFFVGIDRKFHEYASDLYNYILIDERLPESLRGQLGTLSNPLSKDTPGIQAADLLAYRMYRASLDALSKPNYEPPALLMKLLRNWKGKLALRLMNSEIFAAMEQGGREAYERMIKDGTVTL